jgi:hypothetical protein
MKTLKQILSTANYAASTPDLENFVAKHEVEKTEDANGNKDDVFQATNVKYVKRKAERHGYDKPEDEKMHEETIMEGEESHKMFQEYHTEIAKDLKGIQKALSNHYNTVTNKKAMNSGMAHWHHVEGAKQIHRALADIHQQIRQHVDYDQPMIVKEESELEEKTLTKAEMKKREEIAQAIERDTPSMPMAKKMAIATATAKRVAEETTLQEDLIEFYFALNEEDREEFISVIDSEDDDMLLEYFERVEA